MHRSRGYPYRFWEAKVWLSQQIASQAYRPGDRLPSESQLASALGVSRATIREALRALEQEGLVYRRHGVGTFVRSPHPAILLRLEVNLAVSEQASAAGLSLVSRTLAAERVVATEEEAQRLNLPSGEEVWRLERLRLLDENPVLYTIDTVPAWVVPDGRRPPSEGSIYRFLEEECRQTIAEGTARLLPVQADLHVARRLRVRVGTLLQLVDQVDFNREGKPILASREYYLPSAFEFRVRRRRV